MSLDLGDLEDLARALGLLDSGGTLVPDWFSRPGHYLTSVLRQESQRTALLAFVADLLDEGTPVTDAAGRQWLPVVRVPTGQFSAYAVVGSTSTAVELGAAVGVDVTAASGVRCTASVNLPLFAQPFDGSAVTPLPGTPGAMVDISVALTLPGGTSAGGVGLSGVSLALAVPTHPGDSPHVGLTLTGLTLPGAVDPVDLAVSADSVAELDQALLHLVLGLVQAEAAALAPTAPLRGLADLLGLGGTVVPDFPVADLLARGPAALADWLAQALGDLGPRTAWLNGLATLVGGTPAGTADDPQVQVVLGPATLRVALVVAAGASGRPKITPTLTLSVDGAAGVTLSLEVDPVSVDLGTGTAVAVPALRLAAVLAGEGGADLLPPVTGPAGLSVGLARLEAGFALDSRRRPLLVLQAVRATVGAASFPVLDLTSADALAAAGQTAIGQAAASLLTHLGPAATVAGVLLGLTDPPGGPALSHVDPTALLSDPLAALATYWDGVLTGAPAALEAVLGVLRDAIADAAQHAVAVTGDGSAELPWRVPLADGVALTARYLSGVLVLGASVDVAAGDVAGSGVAATLRSEVTLVELGLTGPHARRGAFLPVASGSLRFTDAAGGRLSVGAVPAAVSAAALGLGLTWSTGSDLSGLTAGQAAGLRCAPVADDVQLDLAGSALPVPLPVVAADGTLALDDTGWAAMESLAAAAASAAAQVTGSRWPLTLAELLGWASSVSPGRPGSPSAAGGPRLSLAELVTSPEQALRDYAGQLFDVAAGSGPLFAVLQAVGELLGVSTSVGTGRPDEPWRLPLLGAAFDAASDLAPSLFSALKPQGPATGATTLAGAVVGWQPGDPDLATGVLVSALASEAGIDGGLRDLLAGRGDVLTGLDDVLARLVATDGLVTLPDAGLPPGVTGHRLADLAHSTALDRVDLSGLGLFGGGAPPATIVHVAVIAPGLPAVLPDVPADHVVDLTAASVPPSGFGFTTPAVPSGSWAVRLGPRAACRLETSDPDGVAGQAARLARVLAGLTAAVGTPVLVLAHGAAGHAAVRACAGLPGVAAVVTVGTAWSTVAVDTLDRVPGAEVLHLLGALIPVPDPAEPDDPDLGLARGLLDLWSGLDALSDPLAELRVPGTPTDPGGTPVHAVVGALAEPTVRRAVTAVFVAGLATRAVARAVNPGADPQQTRAGLRLPFLPEIARAGLVCSLHVDLDLGGALATSLSSGSGSGSSAVVAGPRVVVRFSLGAQSGWLVGGPDPGRAPGIDRPLALRRLTAEVSLPLGSLTGSLGASGSAEPAATASARLDLHDASTFGVRSTVLTVAGGPDAPAGAVPALPEVRALLAEVATRLDAAAADPTIAALRDGLSAIGLLSTGGASGAVSSTSTALGIDPVTLGRLFADPGGMASAVAADPARRARLAAALRVLTGDTRDAATAASSVALTFGGDPVRVGATFDLATGTISAEASGSTGVGWALGCTLSSPGPAVTVTARVGTDLTAASGLDPALAATLPQGLALLVAASSGAPGGTPPGLTASLLTARPGEVRDVTLWPAPDPAAIVRALAAGAPAVLVHTLLAALRARMADAAPAAAGAVDGVLDALGLLSPQRPAPAGSDPADPLPARTLRLPAALVADPGAWLRAVHVGPSALSTAVPALLDGLRVLLDAGSTPGRLTVAPGVAVRAASVSGRLELAVDVDGTAFDAGAAPVGRLVLGGSAGLSLDPANPIGPGTRPAVALALDVTGVGGVRLGVGPRADATIGVTLAVHPQSGVEIPILPAGPGLGSKVVAGAVLAALPALLDTVATLDPAGTPSTVEEIAGRLVTRVGDALALRADTGHGLQFDPAALATFSHDPAAALAARASAVAANGLTLLVDAAQPLLGPSVDRGVTTAGSALVVTIGQLELRWTPGSAKVAVTVAVPSGVPGVESVVASVTVDGTGLLALDVAVGPASLDAGPLTLRPFARVRAGSAPAGGRAVEVGLGLNDAVDASAARLVARLGLDGGVLSLISSTGPVALPVESTQPVDVALAAVSAVLDLAGSVVLSLGPVSQALDKALLGTTARTLLTGVLIDAAHPDHLDPALLDRTLLVHRLGVLLNNLSQAPAARVTIAGALTLAPNAHSDSAGGTVFGLTLGLDKPFLVGGSDLTVSLEANADWIHPPTGTVAPGLTLDVLTVPAGNAPPVFTPELVVGGVGVRLARSSAALLDTVIVIESVGVDLFADVRVDGAGSVRASGGARLELAGLSVGLGGGNGGGNPVASGLLAGDGGSDKPKPRFSPAIAIQKHGTDAAFVTFTAGDGAGPWWVVIQRGFGPIYIEQVGLAVTMSSTALASVGLLVDGKVSLLGLTASVDELSVTYLVSTGSPLDPNSWAVDLAGLAVSADLGGIALAGGLRKVPSAAGGTEYLGLLMAKMAVYGISVYGGYGLVGPAGDQFASLFLFGAVNGPIGGPPAFFVTGIGGGFGINRGLTYPSDLAQFPSYPFIKALDPAARPGDPMAELEQVRSFFPAQRGSFWFAAGISFTAFALVDGVVVIAVQIGDGFELALLGLARMALPRPGFALVSVELALIARVSTKEGVVLVQAQLTDNSWLLFESIRLTGGFAFASWFGGPNRGQMVLTLGGYHPSFHRDGYPVVPRLGIAIDLDGYLSITGGAYFALTSEAVMAGASITASADFGPAWAHLTVGGDGIVFFDPFWFDVTVYAAISAGISIDVWIGHITISVSLSARVELTGPPFHGKASFSVGPADLEIEFGDLAVAPVAILWDAFVPKYLQEAAPGVAHVLGAITGAGAIVPKGAPADGGARSPDGSNDHPFLVAPEFQLTVTSLAPVRRLVAGGATVDLPTVPEVSTAPMRTPATPTVTLAFTGPGHLTPSQDRIDKLARDPQALGAFAIGTWGPAQSQDAAKVPAGDVLTGVDRVLVTAAAQIAVSATGAPAIPYHQVEVDPFHRRRPLPFVTEGAAARRTELGQAATTLHALVPAVPAGATTLDVAAGLLGSRAGRSPADVAAWTGDRRSQPILASLGEGLGVAATTATVNQGAPPGLSDPVPPRPPQVLAMLASPVGQASVPTVRLSQAAPGTAAPGTAAVAAAGLGAGHAELVRAASSLPPPTLPPSRSGVPVTTVSDALLALVPGTVPMPVPALADVDSGLVGAVPARLLRLGDSAVPAGSTVLAAGDLPISRSGRSGVEVVADRGAQASTRSHLAGLAAALLPGSATATGQQGGGMPVAGGSVAVLRLPDADRDVDPARRPTLSVGTGAVRLVAVGPGGQVLLDERAEAGDDMAIPAGVRVVAIHPVRPAVSQLGTAAAHALDVHGWDAATPLPYLGDELLLAAGSVLASAGRVPWRRAMRVGTGWVSPDALTDGPTAVSTRFAEAVDTVAVALEGGAGADDLALGLDGASRPLGPDGRAVPPVLVADGARAVAVFAVVPDSTRGAVTVTVSTGPARRLAGVAATRGSGVTALAQAFASRGFADVVPDPVPSGTAGAVVFWKEA